MKFYAKTLCDIDCVSTISIGTENSSYTNEYDSLEELVRKELGYSLILARQFCVKNESSFNEDLFLDYYNNFLYNVHFKIHEDVINPEELKYQIFEIFLRLSM